MSKYIDRSKVNDEIVRVLEHTDCKDEYIDRVLMAIEKIPTIEVSEDCISRKWLEKNAEEFGGYYEDTVYAFPLSKLDNAPSVIPICQKNRQVERAEGEWIEKYYKGVDIAMCECSYCHNHHERANYCPTCGAKMKGAE